MLVKLASQYPTRKMQIQHSDRRCHAEQLSTGSSDECSNMSSIRLSPKSQPHNYSLPTAQPGPVLEDVLLQLANSAWPSLCRSKQYQLSHQPNCKPSSYCCSSSSCHGTLLRWQYAHLFIIIIIIITILTPTR